MEDPGRVEDGLGFSNEVRVSVRRRVRVILGLRVGVGLGLRLPLGLGSECAVLSYLCMFCGWK